MAKRLTYRKIHEQIAELLEADIMDGKLQPGEKLPSTRELSVRYRVGMSTVREALSALKAKGLVESRQGEGSFIRQIVPEEVRMPDLSFVLLGRKAILELLEARKALEIANAGIAAEKRSKADIARLADIVAQMERNIGEEEEGERADMAFHLALAQATHNSVMVRLLETISAQMELAIRETRRLQMYANRSVSERLWREHREIFAAVEAKDAALAQQKMALHLYHVERVLLKNWQET